MDASTEYSATGDIIAQGQYSDGEKNGPGNIKPGDTDRGRKIYYRTKRWIMEILLIATETEIQGKLCSG
jgi:hypothetical protein